MKVLVSAVLDARAPYSQVNTAIEARLELELSAILGSQERGAGDLLIVIRRGDRDWSSLRVSHTSGLNPGSDTFL
jgi:hypothetical protein